MTDPGTPVPVEPVDHVLATTRAVRRRLDLTRPVPAEVLLECIDLAEQAPTGGNQSSRRWIVIVDPERKAALGQLYRDAIGDWMTAQAARLAGTGHPNEKTMASAAHLAQHMEEVPALVIATIYGVHDGSGRPGLFDSVIQAAWSFCLALRARGLGTAWTTAWMHEQDRVAELLGIPAGVTQIVLLPVGYTVGTDFARAPRRPAREITWFDGWGLTTERPTTEPVTLADEPGVTVEIDVKAPPEQVEPAVRAIEESEAFAGRHDEPGATWWFELEPIAGATRLRFSVLLGPDCPDLRRLIEAGPATEGKVIDTRRIEHRGNMVRTVEDIAAMVRGD